MKILVNKDLQKVSIFNDSGIEQKSMDLPRIEYMVLLHLHENIGIYTSGRNLSTILHGNEHCISRLSDVYVAKVRSKLGKHIIISKAGLGYMLNDKVEFEFVNVKSREEKLLEWLSKECYFDYIEHKESILQDFKNTLQ